MEEYNAKYNIAIIYMLCDSLERKLKEFKPVRTLNLHRAMIEFETCLIRVERLRSYMDKYLKEFAEGWGDEADNINELIENYIKQVETNELAKQNGI